MVGAPVTGDDTQSAAEREHPWIATIERAQKSDGMAKWATACDVVRKQYRYENSTATKTRRYQMLWSNIEVMKGATYAKPPQAAVSRRYRDKDDTARQATLMVERCINFTFDVNNYHEKFEQVRDDFLLYARGQARVVYEPVMESTALRDDGLDGADVVGPAGELAEIEDEAKAEGDPQEILTFEHVKVKYVQREDFVHSPARVWDEVTWCAFRSYLDRGELIARFGEDIGQQIGLDSKSDRPRDQQDSVSDGEPKATIWEVWDKAKNRVLWVAADYPDVLEESEPYLKLSGFFPCPRPAFGTLTNDSLAPRPDYIFYQDQAEEINTLTARIASLQESLKLVGFYPAGPEGEGFPEIERAVQPGVENKMIAIKSFAAFAEGGKGGAPIVWLPIDQVVKVLEGCVKLRSQLTEDVYQITGLSDIIRGATNPNETKGAQVLKSQHGGMRIATRQGELARFCRDICRLVGEIICNHFQPETIMAMSNLPLPTDNDVLMQIQQQQAQMMAQQQVQARAAQTQALLRQAQGGQPGSPGPQGPQPGPMPPGAPPPAPIPSLEDMQRAEIQQRMNHAHEAHQMAMHRAAVPRHVLRDEHGRIAGIQ